MDPFLPPELEQEIFEIAAGIHPDTIPTLLRVARRVHEWISKVKYKIITTAGEESTLTFRRLKNAIRAKKSKTRPAAFFQNHVLHLFSQDHYLPDLREVMGACSGIKNLVLAQPDALPSTLPAALRLRRVGLYLDPFVKMDPRNSMFTLVTHLDIYDHPDAFPPTNDFAHWWPLLARLPALTHLSIYMGIAMILVPKALVLCKKLEVLICMHIALPDESEVLEEVHDERFLHMFLHNSQYPADWVTGARGGSDFWVRAEAFIGKKRRGEIQPGLLSATFNTSCSF
ncbi:hypothetical protein B0H16DRAFT_1838334 [Mycena metata]|uniref:Uncharacterized protein n=1 Tax=Mycena metata TaxID=1033252 RepID=A0AAD7K5Y5_9AGAR|nr:hypothetical protein B0H16DRAFT_1838334 [Mycena metata]